MRGRSICSTNKWRSQDRRHRHLRLRDYSIYSLNCSTIVSGDELCHPSICTKSNKSFFRSIRFNIRTVRHHVAHRVRKSMLLAMTVVFASVGVLGEDTDSDKSVSVTEYCETFVLTFARTKSKSVVAESIRVSSRRPGFVRLTNLFQPPGSRYLGGFQCKFALSSTNGEQDEFTVDIYLVESLEFAEHTQWKDLQIVSIKIVKDSKKNLSGYGVFKYLKQIEPND